MRRIKWITGVLLASMLLTACAVVPGAQPSATPLTPTPQDAPLQPPAAALAAQRALAERLGFAVEDVVIAEIEETEWPDGCLGLGGPAESCMAVIVPGYRVMLTVDGETYEVRTDRVGEVIRFAEPDQTGSPSGGEVVAGETVRQLLAKRLGLDLEAVKLVSAEAVDFQDACLGYGSPVELCAAAITPGYRVIVEAEGASYEFHTDAEVLRVRTQGGDETFTSLPRAVLEEIDRQLNVDPAALIVIRSEQMDWPDECLGVVPATSRVCAQVVTPGWLVVMEVDGVEREFHSNMNGSNVIEYVESGAQNGAPVSLVWQVEGETCREARFTADTISYGSCDFNNPQVAPLTDTQIKELVYLAATFHSFQAHTPSGTVQFTGHGAQVPTLAQQRAFAEWARLARASAEATAGSNQMMNMLTWSRQGGFAGFCDQLRVEASGFVYASSCKQPDVEYRPVQLNTAQLERVYNWLDSYAPFAMDQGDPAVADAMRVQMNFSGRGRQNYTQDLLTLMQAFAMEVYNTAAQQNPQ